MSFTVQEDRKTVGHTCPYPITFESTLWQFSCTVVLSEQKGSYFERVSMPSVITWKCSCGARYRARCDNFDNSRDCIVHCPYCLRLETGPFSGAVIEVQTESGSWRTLSVRTEPAANGD